MTAELPSEIAKTWPTGIAKVELGGINIGGHIGTARFDAI